MLGFQRAELENRRVETLLPAAGRVFYQTHFFPLLKLHGRVEEVYIVLRAKDGAGVPVLAYAKRREGANDCVFIRVTHRERYQDEIAKARERMIGILGHDLRVPLTAVTLGAEELLRNEKLSGQGQHTALAVLASARRAARMTTDLLDFTRARFAGGIPVHPKPADLAEVAEKVIAEIHSVHRDVKIELSVEGDCRGSWDADRAAQVIANLTGNAIDHGSEDAPIVVRLQAQPNAVVLEARNATTETAPNVEDLFSPFRQRAGSAGLGLGLFIVKEIMEAHGGSVLATNEAGEFRVRAVWPVKISS